MAAPDTSLTAAIVEREPALALPGSPIAKAESALRWASGVMTWNNEVPTHLPEFATLTARQMVEEVFLPRAYGVMCGGMAIFLCRILEQFAIRSLVVQCGYEAGVNHVTVLVPDRGKFFLFDPMFSGTYRPVGEWRHLDLAAVLRGESFVFRTNRAAPIILKRPEEVERTRLRWRDRNIEASWETEPNAFGWVAAYVASYDFQYRLVAQPEEIAALGMAPQDDFVSGLIRRRTFAVTGDPGDVERCIAMLGAAGANVDLSP
jgi:hypothetical protein